MEVPAVGSMPLSKSRFLPSLERTMVNGRADSYRSGAPGKLKFCCFHWYMDFSALSAGAASRKIKAVSIAC